MFRQDFIKRQIEAFAEVLARLAGRRNGGEPEHALLEARDAFRALGVDPNLLDLDARSILRMLREREKAEALCLLLDELAASKDALERAGTAGAVRGSVVTLSAADLRAQSAALRAEIARESR
jgi:hypothetical protein